MIFQTGESFWSEMVRLSSHSRLTKFTAYAFDAAWVIVLALNASMADGLTYERLKKRTRHEVRLIKKWIRNTNFEGITVGMRGRKNFTFSWVDTSASTLNILNGSSPIHEARQASRVTNNGGETEYS